MRADYDSQAEALSIDLAKVDRWDDSDPIDDTYCHVALRDGHPVNIELLNPRERLSLLEAVADKYGLDAVALRVAAEAALAGPDRPITLDVGSPAPA